MDKDVRLFNRDRRANRGFTLVQLQFYIGKIMPIIPWSCQGQQQLINKRLKY